MTMQLHDRGRRDATCEQCIFATDTAHFDHDVIAASKDRLVLVDLWADWCGPCHTISPVLTKLIAEYGGRVVLAKVEVDVDDNMKIAGRYGARGFPTVLLFANGELLDRFHGAKPEHYVREFIARHLAI